MSHEVNISFYHIFVRKTYLFACVINEEVPDPYQSPVQIPGYLALCQWRHCDTQADVTDEEAKNPQIDTAEMKNVNTKRKTNKNTQSSGVMASMLFLSVVDRGFKIWSCLLECGRSWV
jgi:hypothetical protein